MITSSFDIRKIKPEMLRLRNGNKILQVFEDPALQDDSPQKCLVVIQDADKTGHVHTVYSDYYSIVGHCFYPPSQQVTQSDMNRNIIMRSRRLKPLLQLIKEGFKLYTDSDFIDPYKGFVIKRTQFEPHPLTWTVAYEDIGRPLPTHDKLFLDLCSEVIDDEA